jgi:hypothetical protein
MKRNGGEEHDSSSIQDTGDSDSGDGACSSQHSETYLKSFVLSIFIVSLNELLNSVVSIF